MYATSYADKGKTSESPGDLDIERNYDTFTKKPDSPFWKIPGVN